MYCTTFYNEMCIYYLFTGGENDHLNAIKERSCIKCIEENRDIIVGVKVRLDR